MRSRPVFLPTAMTTAERRISLIAVTVFVLLAADLMVGGLVTHLDGGIRDQLLAHGVDAPAVLTPLGELGNLGIAIPVVVTAGAVSCQVTWRLWPAGFVVAVFGTTEMLVLVSKAVVGRAGPGAWAEHEDYPGYFPSGHTATAMVTAGILLFLVLTVPRESRRRVTATAVSLAGGWTVGAAAGVYAVVGDYHWASDVAGALALTTPLFLVGCAFVRTRIYALESADHAR
jgi:undecaprenyl-diphosphatase